MKHTVQVMMRIANDRPTEIPITAPLESPLLPAAVVAVFEVGDCIDPKLDVDADLGVDAVELAEAANI